MKYNYKGKVINIPDEEIQKSMEVLELSQEEAIQMYLEDEGFEVNEEQEQLTQKAKTNKTTLIHARENVENKKTERKPKENPTKEFLIQQIWQSLAQIEHLTDLKVTNKAKLIEFCYQNQHFKVDLVQKREKKVK